MPDNHIANQFTGLGLRLVSGLVLAGVALGAVYAGGLWFTALVCFIGLLMAREWPELCLAAAGTKPLWLKSPPFAALLFVAVAMAALAFLALGRLYAGIVAAVLGALLIVIIARGPVWDRVLLALGLPYIAVPIAALLCLAAGPGGRNTLYWLLVVVCATDIGGYISGKMIGGPRLAPRLSPGKTWAGMIGGTMLAVVAAIAVGKVLGGDTGPSVVHLAFVGLAVSLAAQIGDLIESAVKRHFEVKDSGSIIPGHGGLFDRLDGLLAGTVVLAGLTTIKNMGFAWN
ncbi:MAG: phosphatidate cytidylyltransferase [Alphaproteobacteria bacterium]